MIDSGFLAAIFLVIVIFAMPVFSRELRQSWFILLAYSFLVVIHQAVAFTNVYLFTMPGTESDAHGFQWWGEKLATNEEWALEMGSRFYMQMLGAVYRYFGSSFLLGEQLSILAFSFSCIVFLKIMREMGMVNYRSSCLIAFGSLPSMVLMGSVTLREPFQILFLMLAVLFGIRMHVKGGINYYMFLMLLSALLGGWFHSTLILYSAFLCVLFCVWTLRPKARSGHVKKLHLAMLVVVPVLFVALLVISRMDMLEVSWLSELFNRNWLEVIGSFRKGSIQSFGRATYGVALDTSSPAMIAYSTFNIYIHYLFAPFPWQVRNALDFCATLESILRMILIFFSVQHWRCAYGPQRRLLGVMLILYFSMTLFWAIGTSNYGTSMRHHLLSWWIIALVGVPELVRTLSHLCRNFIILSQESIRLRQKEVS